MEGELIEERADKPVYQPADATVLDKGPVLPIYLSPKANINDFVAFSDGGWDGNWYIGYNSCWIVKIPKAPKGDYSKAFIGAKIGRAKARPRKGRAFEQEPIPAKIYMAIAAKPAFPPANTFFLTDTADVPLQPDPNLISPRIGDSGWFWTEVPLNRVNSAGDNYLAIWSNNENLVSVASSPVIGAAMMDGTVNAWLNRSIHGAAPRDEATALETQLSRLVPALALKLVPKNDKRVGISAAEILRADGDRILRFSVTGEDIATAWYEATYDRLLWRRMGPLLRHPPFTFTLPAQMLGARALYVRGAAADALGNVGVGEPILVQN